MSRLDKSLLVLGLLLMALGASAAEFLSPGIFNHNHSSANQGGATLLPSTINTGGTLTYNLGAPLASKPTSLTGTGAYSLYSERLAGQSGATWSVLIADEIGNALFGVGWDGLIKTPSLGTGALRTAAGSATCAALSHCQVQFNDFAFLPSIQPTVTGCANNAVTLNQYNTGVDSGVYVQPQLAVDNGCGQSVAIRYRYVTATDHPRIWVVADPTGTIRGVWTADDPTPSDSPALILSPCAGCQTYQFSSADLAALAGTVSPATAALARTWIQAKGYSLANQHYRTIGAAAMNLTAVSGGRSTGPVPPGIAPAANPSLVTPHMLSAPAPWIHAHAVINPAKGTLCPLSGPTC